MTKHLARIACAIPLLAAGSALAFAPPSPSPLADKEVRLAGLDAQPSLVRVADLAPALATELESGLLLLGIDPQHAAVDTRSGRWATLWLRRPLIPGTGAGNRLSWSRLGFETAPGEEALGIAAWNELLGFLGERRRQLRIDPAELEPRVGVASRGQIVQIYASRRVDGVPVRGAGVTATVNQGNLILLGTQRWGDVAVPTVPTLSAAASTASLERHLAPFAPDRYRDKPRLELLPVGTDGPAGDGWTHRLAWILTPDFDGLDQQYEAAVDAHTGEVISLQDANHYAARNVKGGVYPVSYDGASPDGVEVPGYPMPYAGVTHDGGTSTTDAGGNVFDAGGTMATTLAGRFILVFDQCGAIGESSAEGDLDLGTSPGQDCDTPPEAASVGNTHSARTGFYELNRIVETARGHWPAPGSPANAWLNSRLTAVVNIDNACNAFWDGVTVNFYREGDACANTGQLAGVFDHEWGHGIDDYGTNGSVSFPGEGIADLYAALRLDQSCIGRGYHLDGSLCGGYGDPCTPASACTGIRDIDWANRASGLPHDIDWVNGNPNCGSVHCRGAVYAEAVWDLLTRDLPAFYGMDGDTAREITTRLTFLGSDNVGTWFVLTDGDQGGCGADSGYQQFLGADDDNGDLLDGTPHMQAIFAAFDRHQIACSTPAVQDSGCASAPTTPPAVTISPDDTGADLAWTAVPGATRYKVFRTDGEFQCDFGKAIVGETAVPFFSDRGLQNGREYFYVVAAFGASDACMGPASACAVVVPRAGLSAAEFAVEICAGADAAYTIAVSAPFAPPVDMSLTGNPLGTTAAFVPDPVSGPLPEDTVLTIGDTAAAAAGDYLMSVTGDDTVTVADVDLLLRVFDAAPSAPGLVAPADGAVDLPLAPTYQWMASTQGHEYVLEVDDDPGFGSIDYTAAFTDLIHEQTVPLAPETEYFWRVRTANPCGDGATSSTDSFTTRVVPPILLVDDDDNDPDTRGLYQATLDRVAGLAGFDVWDTHNTDHEPTALDLAPYRVVIWFSGDEWQFNAAGPGPAGEAALATWLEEQAGCLFLSSQDYHYNRGLTAFMQEYLGVASVVDDSGDYLAVTAVPGGVFDGLGTFPLDYEGTGLSEFVDIVTADSTSEVVLDGIWGRHAALHKDSGTYQALFLVFPWETIHAAGREAMLDAVLTACATGSTLVFEDGFESGDTAAWSTTVDPAR